MHNLSRAQKLELLELLEEKKRCNNVNRYKTYHGSRYPWQKKFIANTAEYSQVALIAANRVGKTDTATYIDAIHALGDYSDEWPGHKFDPAPLIWILGYSGEKCRDLLQTPLIGREIDGRWSGGLIPGDLIVDVESMTISESEWGSEQNQDEPDSGPWLSEVLVSGSKTSGSIVTLSWTFNVDS
ncbi:hypothetical protein [Erwinia mallotivora]|uniref:hypothetical protein n=1 Tax=Erwinia mallotivora TaxID=69222 RepID=UPI0021BF251B|nr:hypothetical protein [Erwinia mallotivora]